MKLERNRESLSDDISLYHITTHYKELLEDGEVYMKRPMYWEDTYEAFLIQQMLKENSLERIAELFLEKFAGCIDSKLWTMCSLLAVNQCSYAFCLSDELPTDKKWDEYTKGKTGICIETTPSLIERAIQNALEEERVNVDIKKIDYLNTDAMKLEDYFDWLNKNKTITDCYFHKMKSFDWEKEVRLLIYNSEIFTTSLYGGVNTYRRVLISEYRGSYPSVSEKLDGLNENEKKELVMQIIKYVINERYKEDGQNDHFNLKLRPADYIKSVSVNNASTEEKQIIEKICETQKLILK